MYVCMRMYVCTWLQLSLARWRRRVQGNSAWAGGKKCTCVLTYWHTINLPFEDSSADACLLSTIPGIHSRYVILCWFELLSPCNSLGWYYNILGYLRLTILPYVISHRYAEVRTPGVLCFFKDESSAAASTASGAGTVLSFSLILYCSYYWVYRLFLP